MMTNFRELLDTLDSIQEKSCFYILDSFIYRDPHYAELMRALPKAEGIWVLGSLESNNENYKTLSHYEACVRYLLTCGMNRRSHLVAIGGGVVSDFAGFVASTFMRGVAWSVVPTTLVAMVDASHGGKVALNLPEGKNLLGAFYPPRQVLMASFFLETLSEEEWLCGMGEVYKYGFLNEEIRECLNQGDQKPSHELIELCVQHKNFIVDQDPCEQDVRKTLNLGHTFGHAIEKHFGLSHGKSVIFGLLWLFDFFELSGERKQLEVWCGRDFPDFKFVLPLKEERESDADALINFLMVDKKNEKQHFLIFVLPSKKGELMVKQVEVSCVRDFVSKSLRSYVA